MNRDEALEKSNHALTELASSLQQGKSETLMAYLDAMSKFHRYSFGNCLLIALQRPNATLVAGYHRWKELHRWVKKGEVGIAILAPLVTRKRKGDAGEDGADREPTTPQRSSVVGFRVVRVFDVSQTEGKELPQFALTSGDPGERLARVEDLVRSKGIELQYEDDLGGALGVSRGGTIAILSSLTYAQKFATLVHELAHELLHRGDRRQETTKVVRETEAEAVAYVVCRSVGLDCSTQASDYIQLYSGDQQILMQSLELIRGVASAILTELETPVSEEVADVA